jgi:uncharacterized protein (DUF1015 family)
MAEILPFHAYRYDSNRFDLKDVLTQPYDKITPAMQEKYYAASPANLIAIEKGKTFPNDTPQENVYTRAGKKVQEWIAEKVLVRDRDANIYAYSQEFEVPGTNTRKVRVGFIALGRVEDYEAQVVFRHERTLSAPKADRIKLLRHTGVQTGQLFLLYDDPSRVVDTLLEQTMRKAQPVEMTDEYDVIHRLWPVSDPGMLKQVQAAMADKKVVIADGHHRYETALTLRNEGRAKTGGGDRYAGYEFAMMTFINTRSKGLVILPTHRLVANLPDFNFEAFRKKVAPYLDWYSYPFQNADERATAYAEFRKDLESHSHGRRTIGVYVAGNAFYLFLLRADADLESLLPDTSEGQRGLDVVLLHRLILDKGLGISAEAVTAEKNVSYAREMDAAIAEVDRGAAQIAFLLNPVPVQQVADVAMGGDVMPQKSTDFYPKLLSGIAIYRPEEQASE